MEVSRGFVVLRRVNKCVVFVSEYSLRSTKGLRILHVENNISSANKAHCFDAFAKII
jgi:hypothetical protein